MANARAQRRSGWDRFARNTLIVGVPAVLLVVAGKIGLLDPSPDHETNDPAEAGTEAPTGTTTFQCIGFKAIHGDDGNLHLTPKFRGDVPGGQMPDGTVVTYMVRYGGDLEGPMVAPLGEVVVLGHPDEVRASVLLGGDPAQSVPCSPWED